ncbi:hypothetical protein KP509_24G016000 [Ceratopteris richardii]|uniref:Uncharacterized protein n=1 Tax=Ceratopteris richardii TaxID=49495 RepID=A0A8T2RST5_CERRI|nr:hypothetical protein KP509_24G016000 [Ceratopteris richardii]
MRAVGKKNRNLRGFVLLEWKVKANHLRGKRHAHGRLLNRTRRIIIGGCSSVGELGIRSEEEKRRGEEERISKEINRRYLMQIFVFRQTVPIMEFVMHLIRGSRCAPEEGRIS